MLTNFLRILDTVYTQSGDEMSILGQLLMLDDKTPHVACVVQAVKPSADGSEPTIVATTLSDELGRYQFTNFKPGPYQVRCYTLNGYIYYQEGKILRVGHRRTLKNIDFLFPPFKKGMWKTYTTLDGLAHNAVTSIYQDLDELMWFGTEGGVSYYDGKDFVN